jgi:hypothetical protein
MHHPTPAKRKRPWRNALITTTGLSAFFLLASQLWLAGYEQWAFVLGFLAVWTVISISWSNVDFTEESGTILARIVDHNFENQQARLDELETEIAQLRQRLQSVSSFTESENSG